MQVLFLQFHSCGSCKIIITKNPLARTGERNQRDFLFVSILAITSRQIVIMSMGFSLAALKKALEKENISVTFMEITSFLCIYRTVFSLIRFFRPVRVFDFHFRIFRVPSEGL